MRSGHLAGIVLLLIMVSTLACGGRRTVSPPTETPVEPSEPEVPGEPVPAGPGAPTSLDTLPVWVDRPDLHPRFGAPRYLGAVGSSVIDPDEADRVARERLRVDLGTRIDTTRIATETAHPYWMAGGTLDEGISSALDPEGGALRRIYDRIQVDREGWIRVGPTFYAMAYLDLATIDSEFARSDGGLGVTETFDLALEAAAGDGWFGFAHWTRRGLSQEADRVALRVVREAVGEDPGPLQLPDPRQMAHLRVAADSLWARHGWSLRTDFDWKGNPPPPQIQPRIQERLVSYLLDRGFQIGFGSGCPSPSRSDDEDRTLIEPLPHHVIRVRTEGKTDRTMLAWVATVDMTLEVRSCGSGELTFPIRLGSLEGEHDRDPEAALYRALDWERFDALLGAAFEEIGLLFPREFAHRSTLP